MKIRILFSIIFYYSILKKVSCYDLICNPHETCENCLGANFDCTWCTDKNYSNRTRCMREMDAIKSGCNPLHILKNSPELKIVENENLQDFQSNGIYAQIKPQKIKIKLVKSHTQRFKMTYRPAENYPLDLYFLMDLTWSMRDDKNTLTSIGEQLAIAMENLTKNFRLGFGSFADKPALPMISPTTKSNPCGMLHDKCEPTYGYHHHLPLTKNIHDFVRKVNISKITANLDNLEGGLDALMQVIVCPNEIGWTEDARKIVIFATDGLMHFAGDGLLAGIIQKNDKKCHLEQTESGHWEYTGSLEYDYPSLEEIYRELLKRKVNVIFAVTKDVETTYRQMRNIIKDVSEVGTLKNDSSNILDLIKKGYESFTEKAFFTDNSPPYIKITYETDCGGSHELIEKNNCDNVKTGKQIDFYINITLTDFPNDEKYKHLIRIDESSLSEFLELEVDIQKPCPCKEQEEDKDTSLCNNHGVFSCGMCNCDQGWIGFECSCDSRNYLTIQALEKKCRKPLDENGTTLGPICSNQGECECGKCHCYLGYEGEYCECRRKCETCKENFECVCGECVCKKGWSGPLCACPEANDSCIAPNGEICLNHGKCKCGACECDESFYGKFCEINVESGSKLCKIYEPCVKCLIEEKQGTNKCENMENICSANKTDYTFVEEKIDSENKCLTRLKINEDFDCDHYYEYNSDRTGKSHIKIHMESCKTALEKAAFYGLIVFVATILLGLLILLVCKCMVYCHDKQEYAQFEKQVAEQSFENQSPIYKSPITHYRVPKPDEAYN